MDRLAYRAPGYAATRGFAPREQMPVADFIRYGCWFQEQAVPDRDKRKVRSVEQTPHGFCLRLDDGERVLAGRVVVAMGSRIRRSGPRPLQNCSRKL